MTGTAGDRATLTALQESIEAAGLETRLAEPSDAIPVPQLLTLLSDTLDERPLRCEIIVLPDLPEPPVLQFFVPLPFHVEAECAGDLARLLHMFNNVMPVHGFGMLESAGDVFFRLLLPYRDGALDGQLVVETLFLIGACIDFFGGSAERLATGDVSLDEATTELQGLLGELEAVSRWSAPGKKQ